MKGQIADMMEGQGTSKGSRAGPGSRFSQEELKELFKLQLSTKSDTYDLICRGHSRGSSVAGEVSVQRSTMLHCRLLMSNPVCCANGGWCASKTLLDLVCCEEPLVRE